MVDQTDLMTALKNLVDSKGSLRTKRIIIQGNQTVFKKVGTKFSWKLWFNNATKQDYSFNVGRYPIYNDYELKDGDKYFMLEFAQLDLNRNLALTPQIEGENLILHFPYGKPYLQFIEVTEF